MKAAELAEASDRVRAILLSHAGRVVPEATLLLLMPSLNRPKAVMQLKEAIRTLKHEDHEPIRKLGSGYVYLLSGETEPAPVYAAEFVSTLKERGAGQGDLFGGVP